MVLGPPSCRAPYRSYLPLCELGQGPSDGGRRRNEARPLTHKWSVRPPARYRGGLSPD